MGLVLGVMGRTATGPKLELKAGLSFWIQTALKGFSWIKPPVSTLMKEFAPALGASVRSKEYLTVRRRRIPAFPTKP